MIKSHYISPTKKKAPRKFRYQMLSLLRWGVWGMMTFRRRRTRRSTMRKDSWILVPRHRKCWIWRCFDDFRFPHQFLVLIFFDSWFFVCRGCMGVGVISIFHNIPLWLESWRAGFICPISKEACRPCPSQQQQWETRWGRNSAGDWCLAPPGCDMWWHTSVHTPIFQWFSYSTQLWLVINCHSQD